MAFLTVAQGGTSIDVPIPDGGADLDTIEIGDRARAFDGTQRASITARKAVITVSRTLPMLTTDAAALRALLIATPTVTASGDLPGRSFTAWPKLGKNTPVMTPGGHRVVMTFTLDES